MSDIGAIRAGKAAVEVRADNSKLAADLSQSVSQIRAYNDRIAVLNRRAKAAQKAGNDELASHLQGISSRTEERRDTLDQQRQARAALLDRLAVMKSGRAALVAEQKELAERLFQATHDSRQVELRDLDQHFAQLRLKYAGNAAMIGTINRTHAAELNRYFMAQGAAEATAQGGMTVSAATPMAIHFSFLFIGHFWVVANVACNKQTDACVGWVVFTSIFIIFT